MISFSDLKGQSAHIAKLQSDFARGNYVHAYLFTGPGGTGKRSAAQLCAMAALCRGESHGYQIVKDLTPSVSISESTLYPILRRLEEAGCLVHRSVEHSGRLRKLYSLTPLGRLRIDDFLESQAEVEAIYDYVRRQKYDES